MQKPNIIAIANRIRSIYNVGAIFRVCDAIGAKKLYLTNFMATPTNQPLKLAKTALGAEKSVPWEVINRLIPIINKLRSDGFEIIALEKIPTKSIDYRKWKPKQKIAIILGNEKTGLSPKLQKLCNRTIHLPMFGKKESLNVATAFSAIAYYILSKIK